MGLRRDEAVLTQSRVLPSQHEVDELLYVGHVAKCDACLGFGDLRPRFQGTHAPEARRKIADSPPHITVRIKAGAWAIP